MKAVKLTKLVQEMNLKNLTPEVDMEHVLHHSSGIINKTGPSS